MDKAYRESVSFHQSMHGGVSMHICTWAYLANGQAF